MVGVCSPDAAFKNHASYSRLFPLGCWGDIFVRVSIALTNTTAKTTWGVRERVYFNLTLHH